jgi:hypothetical protein
MIGHAAFETNLTARGACFLDVILGASQGADNLAFNQSFANPRDKPEDEVRVFGKVRILGDATWRGRNSS